MFFFEYVSFMYVETKRRLAFFRRQTLASGGQKSDLPLAINVTPTSFYESVVALGRGLTCNKFDVSCAVKYF